MDKQRLRDALGDAVTGAPTPLAAADRLCEACVALLDVDGASISFIDGSTTHPGGGVVGGCRPAGSARARPSRD